MPGPEAEAEGGELADHVRGVAARLDVSVLRALLRVAVDPDLNRVGRVVELPLQAEPLADWDFAARGDLLGILPARPICQLPDRAAVLGVRPDLEVMVVV